MTLAEPVVIHPVGVVVVRSYLLSRPEVTALVGQRVGTSMPSSSASPRFPALRLHEITSNEVIPHAWMRMLLQVDCWGVTPLGAMQLARVVLGVLRVSANYVHPDAVLGETQDLSIRYEPDTSLNEAQPRSIVTGHVWIRPN